MNRPYCLLILLFVIPMLHGRIPGAEEKEDSSLPECMLGFNIGYGNQRVGGLQIDSEHDYEVIVIQGQYNFQILEKRTWSLDLLMLPQYNASRYFVSSNSQKDYGYEFGVSAGLQFRKVVLPDELDAYLLLAFGPHYVSGVPDRQDKGFIFSDVAALGVLSKIMDNLFFNLKIGLRHISNASLTHNNGGVNNLIVSAGLMINLRRKNS